jgi:hypothetical protein
MGYQYRPPQFYEQNATSRGGMAARDADGMTPTSSNPLPHLSAEEQAAMIAERKRKEKEEAELKEIARLQAIEAKRQREKDERAARLAAEQELLVTQGKGIAPTYRDAYDAEDPQTFKDAKRVADETYMQFWYDKANAITDNWTDEDYKLLSNPVYKNENIRKGNGRAIYKDVRQLPENYDRYLQIKGRIDYGVLDFTSEEDHKKLINPPSTKHGYGKYQSWISENNPLRQAVEAQSAVMTEWLEEANVDLVVPYEDLDGFKRPDPMRGEGIYLNTGTGAHIDWDSGRLKRMQSYRDVGGEEGGFGEYSTSFIRPDPDYGTFGKVISVIGTITGNPVMRAIGTGLQGGDWKDIAKSHLASEISVPVLEETFATLGIDADLLGIDAETFTDSMMEVQTAMLEGESGMDALIGEFTEPLADKVVDTVKEVLPDVAGIDIDFDTPDIIKDIGDVALAGIEAVGDFVEPVAKKVVDVGQAAVDVAQEVTQPISDVLSEGEDIVKEAGSVFDDEVIQPALEFGEDVVDTIADAGEPVVDFIDDALDTFGEEVVDPVLEVGSDVLSEGEDILKEGGRRLDDLINWDSLAGGMLGGMAGSTGSARKIPTSTESLFDKELFKFDTEIKSTQELLSPMMNLRKYG